MPTQSFGRFEKVLRIGEGRRLKRLAEQAAYITSLEPDFEALTDAELRAKTAEFKQRIENGEIDPSFVITHRVALADAPEAYKTFRDKNDGCIKVFMTP